MKLIIAAAIATLALNTGCAVDAAAETESEDKEQMMSDVDALKRTDLIGSYVATALTHEGSTLPYTHQRLELGEDGKFRFGSVRSRTAAEPRGYGVMATGKWKIPLFQRDQVKLNEGSRFSLGLAGPGPEDAPKVGTVRLHLSGGTLVAGDRAAEQARVCTAGCARLAN